MRKVMGSALFLIGFAMAANRCLAATNDSVETIFQSKCAACHGKDAKGKPSMAKILKMDKPELLDLSRAEVGQKKDEELVASVSKGKGKMPPQEKKVKPDQIPALVKYVRTLITPK